MPNLKLASKIAAKRAKPPSRLERFRSSLSIWQIAIAAVSAVVALALAGVVTHRLKGRADDATDAASEATTPPSSGNESAPGNENALTDTVQKEMFHHAAGSN